MIFKSFLRLAAGAAIVLGGTYFADAQVLDYDSAFANRVANPGDTSVLAAFLTAAVQRGEYDQAISTVEQHLINHPRDAKARLIAGRLYFHLGSWELAKRQAELALEIGTLSAEDTAAAQRLLRQAQEAIEGVATMAFLTGGLRVTYTDYNQDDGAPLDDRVDFNPYVTLGGSVSIDLNTPTSDALILRGTLSGSRQFGDLDFDGVGAVFFAWNGNVSATLSKGMPGIVPSFRGDYTLYYNFQGMDEGLMRQEIGVNKRLSVRPTANSVLYTQAGLGWLGLSSDTLPGEWRGHLEAGAAIRSAIGTVSFAGRGFRDFDAAFDAIGQTTELEAAFAGVIGSIPNKVVWQHRISAAIGMQSVPDIDNPGTTFDGNFWRVGWDHTFQFNGGSRANVGVSYRETEFPLTLDRNTNVLSATAGFTIVLD
jgi:hypothetical protein